MTGAARPQRHCICKPFIATRTQAATARSLHQQPCALRCASRWHVAMLPGVKRLCLNRLDWPSRRPSESDTVVELRRRIDDFPVTARDLHTDTSAVDLDVH